MSFKNEVTLGNLLTVGGIIGSVALGWGTMSARVGAAEDRIEVISKRVMAVEADRKADLARLGEDRRRIDDKLDLIKDRISALNVTVSVQAAQTLAISEQLKTIGAIPPNRRGTVQP